MMTEAAVEVAIRTAIMDYVEGWYEGDAERMNRCLHPRLAKRAAASGDIANAATG